MPRLSFWFAGATVAGALYMYALPTLNEELQQYVQTRETAVLSGERAHHREQVLRVHQLYAALLSTVENERALEVGAGQPATTPHTASSSSSASSSAERRHGDEQRRSQSVLKTNKAILLFYCDVQRLRSLLLRLPLHVQTAEEKLRLWHAADALEAQQCGPTTWLHFRDEPLRWSEWCRSVYGFLCYWVFFRLVPFVWCVDGDCRRWLMHRAALHITSTLEIECEMTVGAVLAEETMRDAADAHTNSRNDNEEILTDTPVSTADTTQSEAGAVAAAPRSEYILLNTQHWVEEVGFWACPRNPLLPKTTAPGVKSTRVPHPRRQLLSGRSDLRRCLDAWRTCGVGAVVENGRHEQSGRQRLWSMQHGAMGAWVWYARPSSAAVAETIPYELHWGALLPATPPRGQTGQSRDTSGRRGVSSSPVSETTVDALVRAVRHRSVTTTLGYPLISDSEEVRRHPPFAARAARPANAGTEVEKASAVVHPTTSSPSPSTSAVDKVILPVGLAGFPRLLYVSAQTATPDIAPRRTRHQMYDYVYREQYKRDPSRRGRMAGTSSTDAAPADADKNGGDDDSLRLTRAEERTLEALHGARVHGGFPWWSPLWWGRVYGGQSAHGQQTRRVLRYHVGSPCALEDYDLEQLDATVKATTEAYAVA